MNKSDFEQRTGEKVRYDSSYIESVMDLGVLVDIDVGAWGGMVQVEAIEINVEEEALKKLIEARKYIWPKSKIKEIEKLNAKLRYIHRKNTEKTLYGYFLLFSDYQIFLEQWEEIVEEIEVYKADILKYYERYKRETIKEWSLFLKKHSNGNTAQMLERIKSLIPPAEEIVYSIYYRYIFMSVPKPSNTIQDLERLKDTLITEEERNAIDAIVRQKTYEVSNELRSFLGSVVGTIQNELLEVCNKAVQGFNDEGEITRGSVKSLNTLLCNIRRFTQFDTSGQLERYLRDIQGMLGPRGERDDLGIKQRLEEVAKTAQKSIEAIGSMGRGAALEIKKN